MTVFLTTQYLEEADQLADRVGIIDDGHIVAEGTPAALKAEIAAPTVEAIPADPRRCEDVTRILAPFGDGEAPHRAGDGIAVSLAGGECELAAVVRALDAESVEIAHLQLHAPSLDDVFLAKTGRTLEGAGEDEDVAEAPIAHVSRATRIQIAALARRSFVRTLRQPAQVVPTIIFPLFLVAVNAGGLEAATELPGFPTNSYLSFAIAVPFIQAAIFAVNNGGADLARDIETGFFDRLALTPMSGGALIVAQLAGVVALGVLQSLIYLAIGVAFGASFDAGPAGRAGARGPGAGDHVRLRLHRPVLRLPHRQQRGGPGPVPGAVRVPVPVLGLAAARPDRAGLVPDDRHLQPGQLPDRGRAQPVHHRLGSRGAGAGLRLRGRDRRGLHGAGRDVPAHEADAHMRSRSVALAVAWRNLHNFFTNPALVIPALLFPLFFFTAFAGGLSSVANAPGFDFPDGYTAFQFVFVILQASAFGGVFTGFAIARDFEIGLRPPPAAGRAASHRRSSSGYAMAALARAVFIWVMLTVVAFAVGMTISGDRRRPAGAVPAGRPARPGRRAVGGRDRAALPLAPGRPADADPGVHDHLPGARVRADRPAARLGRGRWPT